MKIVGEERCNDSNARPLGRDFCLVLLAAGLLSLVDTRLNNHDVGLAELQFKFNLTATPLSQTEWPLKLLALRTSASKIYPVSSSKPLAISGC